MKKSKPLESKISERIARKKSSVLLREDFADLAAYDQVGRALQSLTRKGLIIKIGYGLYAKTRVSTLTGTAIPVESLPALARQALKRLGVRTTPTRAEMDYNEGRSTQIPTGRQIGVEKRVSRKIGFNEASINYEYTRQTVNRGGRIH